jgi:hypothetical protein
MKRKSSSEEDKARDLLYDFLISRDRAPLISFLKLYSAEGLARNGELGLLRVETEVPTNLGSTGASRGVALRRSRTRLGDGLRTGLSKLLHRGEWRERGVERHRLRKAQGEVGPRGAARESKPRRRSRH